MSAMTAVAPIDRTIVKAMALIGVKLRGNPDHPVTRGFLCGKVAQYLERDGSAAR